MSKTCNLFLDKGSDFDAHIQILGVNNKPVNVTGFHFSCQAMFINNPRIKVNVDCFTTNASDGYIHLHIPYRHTERMPAGDWRYDVEMTYADRPPENNRRFKVLRGIIVVTDEVTTCW